MKIGHIWKFALTYGGRGLEKFTCVDSKTWYHDRSYVIEGRQVFFLTRRSLVSISCVSWFVYKCLSSISRLVSLNNYHEKNLSINFYDVSSFFTTFDLRYPIFSLTRVVMTTMYQTSIVARVMTTMYQTSIVARVMTTMHQTSIVVTW